MYIINICVYTKMHKCIMCIYTRMHQLSTILQYPLNVMFLFVVSRNSTVAYVELIRHPEEPLGLVIAGVCIHIMQASLDPSMTSLWCNRIHL